MEGGGGIVSSWCGYILQHCRRREWAQFDAIESIYEKE